MTTLENILLETFDNVAQGAKKTELTLVRGTGDDRRDHHFIVTSEEGHPIITMEDGRRIQVSGNTIVDLDYVDPPQQDADPADATTEEVPSGTEQPSLGGEDATGESGATGNESGSPTSIEGEHTPGDPAPVIPLSTEEMAKITLLQEQLQSTAGTPEQRGGWVEELQDLKKRLPQPA